MTLVILFLVNVLNFYDRLTLGVVAEPVRHEFHLSDAQLGGLTTAFTVLYALAGLPLGRLADTKSRKGILACGVAVWSGLTALGGFASSYAFLMATRVGVGIGEAACAPAATSWIGDVVKPERRTRALAWFMMAVPVGIMLSYSVGGPVSQAYGWRVALALAALPAIALIPALLALREPARISRARATAASPARPGAHARFLVDCPLRRGSKLCSLLLFGILPRVPDPLSPSFGRASWGLGRHWHRRSRNRRRPLRRRARRSR